jgi:hypothetical protein
VPDATPAVIVQFTLSEADDTVPLPVPVPVTVRVKLVLTGAVNVAVTLRAWLIVTWQVVVPLHEPDHPPNVWPLAGVAVSVTTVPLLYDALQFPLPVVIVQLIPEGLDVTVPFPVPAPVTVSAKVGAVTLTTAEPETPPMVAVIETVPAETPVTVPADTVATALLLDVHVADKPVSVLPCASLGVAVSWVVAFGATLTEPGNTSTDATCVVTVMPSPPPPHELAAAASNTSATRRREIIANRTQC